MTATAESPGVSWSESFKGWLAFGQTDFNQAMRSCHGEQARAQLTVSIPSLDDYLAHQSDGGVSAAPSRPGIVTGGSIECDGFNGAVTVTGGTFLAFVTASDREPRDGLHLRMRYDLALRGPDGQPLRLTGFKLIENDPGYDSWSDTTTLFVRIFAEGDPGPGGSSAEPGGSSAEPGGSSANAAAASDGEPPWMTSPVAIGVLCITPLAFMRELASFRGSGRSVAQRAKAVARYQWFFGSSLARAYAGTPVSDARPSFPRDRPDGPWGMNGEAAVGGTARAGRDGAGVPGQARYEPVPGTPLGRAIIPFSVPDLDFPLNLHRLRRLDSDGRPVAPQRGPVLLVPGSGVRAQMYYGQPIGPSCAEFLLDAGYDVWVESWRASIDLPANPYTLDHAAMIDHPRAVETILDICEREGGGDECRAVVHCQGSISFMMAAVAGRLDPRVTQIVSSAVSLFLDVTGATWLKQQLAMPVVSRLFTGLDAQWGIRPTTPPAGLFAAAARRMERPCGNPSCQVASFMYGSGWDVLFRHVDDHGDPWVADLVHEWTSRELGYTPLTLIGQVAESSRHGHVVPSPQQPRPPGTPAGYFTGTPQTAAQITFIAGDHNNMFRWQGQRRAKHYFDEAAGPGQADFVLAPGFGHLDTFWARRAPEAIFPVIRDGLEWKRGEPAPSQREGRLITGGPLPRRRGRLLGRSGKAPARVRTT